MSAPADDPLIQKALSKIDALAAEIVRWQQWVNEADLMEGRPPRFGDIGSASPLGGAAVGASGAKKWKPGDFFNKSFSGAVRQVLIARFEVAKAPSPAAVDDIHEALVSGSFAFEGGGADAQKHSIRTSLGKNSAMFVKLPGTDLFGLTEWYGGRAQRRASPRKTADLVQDDEEPASLHEEAGEAEGGSP